MLTSHLFLIVGESLIDIGSQFCLKVKVFV